MQLIINEFGTFIGKKENLFEIRIKNKEREIKEEYSADKVDQIKILCSSTISSSAIKLAMENNIDIVLTNRFGEPYARIYPCKLGGTTLTRKKQLETYFSEKGVLIVKEIIKAKLQNQLNLLKSLNKTRKGLFKEEISKLNQNLLEFEKINGKNIDEIRDRLLGFEGFSASIYFSCLSKIIPFQKREHEAKDIFNISLNYGYGILYSEIERACIIAGLDPYLGFLHTDRYGKPSLVLDLIEQFRQAIVDRAIINLFIQKQIDDKDLELLEDKAILTKEGRAKVIKAVLERLNSEIKYQNKKISMKEIMQEKIRDVARFILNQKENFEAFVYKP